MIAETLAGIALVKSAVDGIKSAIGTANDIGDIAQHIDNLFEGEKQVQQKRSKKSGGGLSDQFNIKTVAQETIDAKLAQEKLYEMSQLIDYRFGHGTWSGIVTERAKRIQEAKEAALAVRRQKAKKHDEVMETVKLSAVVLGVISVIVMSIIAVFLSAARAMGFQV
tara:strand:+ start:26 stop:523 length:498 start_codon:yes stop_codon:yes gene_type:complete